MSLVDEFKESCTLLERRRVSDGEGGWVTTWEDGPKFMAAIVSDTSMTARVAEHQGVTSTYTVTTDRGTALEFRDAFRRDRDGRTFRVTSRPSDKQTPERASFSFAQVTAEAWEVAE